MEKLQGLLSKLNDKDIRFIEHLYALVYRYLEKRGRL